MDGKVEFADTGPDVPNKKTKVKCYICKENLEHFWALLGTFYCNECAFLQDIILKDKVASLGDDSEGDNLEEKSEYSAENESKQKSRKYRQRPEVNKGAKKERTERNN